MYKHYYCHHTACTNITTVCIQHVQTLLLSAYSMNHHYFCQHTACTNITTVSIQHVPTLLLSAYRKYQNSCCLPTEYSIIISVSTRPNIQHVRITSTFHCFLSVLLKYSYNGNTSAGLLLTELTLLIQLQNIILNAVPRVHT